MLSAAVVVSSSDAETSISVLAVALSLAHLSVNGHPVPLTTLVLLGKFDSIDALPLTISPPVEVVTFNVVMAGSSLSMRYGSVATEQTNTTSTDSEPVQSIGLDNHSTTSGGSLSPRVIFAIVFSVVLFLATLGALYWWRKCYPPRPGRRPIAYCLGVGLIRTGSTTSTTPLPVVAV
ncbi:hypothetical protein C0993_007059 [Termitomyces sp. T159_Od127]|nr:hypothetical protein C0993_007059 [Termitomyces sp. T159_Od127]